VEVDVQVLCPLNSPFFILSELWPILSIIYRGAYASIDAHGLKGSNIIICKLILRQELMSSSNSGLSTLNGFEFFFFNPDSVQPINSC
jgi:hypothetical protein